MTEKVTRKRFYINNVLSADRGSLESIKQNYTIEKTKHTNNATKNNLSLIIL
jgi:hypothetical protein